MQIKEMFAKKIDREIQGVIIVGQGEDSNVSQELEEYSVPRRIDGHYSRGHQECPASVHP